MALENVTDNVNDEDRYAVLYHVGRMLRQATILRVEADKEYKANQRRKYPDETKSDALQIKLDEIRGYLQGRLHVRYFKSEGCYCLIWD